MSASIITDNKIDKIIDDYDLIALIGKSMNNSIISFKIKDAIKELVKASYNVGYDCAVKDAKSNEIQR